MKKRLLSLLLVVVMVFGMFPMTAMADAEDTAETGTITSVGSDENVAVTKTAVNNGDGTYNITISVLPKTEGAVKPLELVLLLDTSGSMAWCTQENHEHTQDCRVLVCGQVEHNHFGRHCQTKCQHWNHWQHTDECYTCGLTTHRHTDDCYNYTCGKHTHQMGGQACTGVEEGAYSRLTIAINAIGDLMDALVEKGITATVTVVTFASSANTLASVNGKTVANQTDADAVKSALTNVTASGGTYMNNGLKKAEEEFETDTTAQQVLIMLADGDYNGTNPYPTDDECAAKRMEKAGIDIYTIAFTTDIDVMAEIAANNGKYSTASDKTALDSIFSSIANDMTAKLADSMGNYVNLQGDVKVSGGGSASVSGNLINWQLATLKEGVAQTITYTVAVDVNKLQVGENLVPLNGSVALTYKLNDGEHTVNVNAPKDTIYVAQLTTEYYVNGVKDGEATVVGQKVLIVDGAVLELSKPADTKDGATYQKSTYDNATVEEFDNKVATSGMHYLRHYYSNYHTVIYDRGQYGNLTGENENGQVVYSNVLHGSTTPEAPTVTPNEKYYFVGWNPEVTDTVTHDVTYVAQYASQFEITVKAESKEFTYDGTEKNASGYTVSNMPEGYTLEGLSASVSKTDAGIYTNKIIGNPVVKDADNNNVTHMFYISTVDGTLTINKRNVTLTSATDSKEYDGTALTAPEVTVEGDGFVSGEVTEIKAVGSAIYPDDVVTNKIEYTTASSFNENNYVITKQEGTLSVTSRGTKYQIQVVANSGEYTYDGNEHTVSGFKAPQNMTFTASNGLQYTIEGLTATGSGRDVNSYTVAISGTAKIKDASGKDVTTEFTITPVNGTLTINKRAVTLTSATDSKEYDGTPLTNDTVTEEGWAEGEGATYDVTGSRTLVGTSANSFTYELKSNTNASNYEITKVEGQLTVTNRETLYTIEVQANSGEYQYDGTEKTVEGFKTLTFEVGGNTYTVSGLTAKANATNAGEYTVNVEGIAVVTDTDGNDVTAQFSVIARPGMLKITKRAVTLTSVTDSKEYDGTPLTNKTVTVSGDGWAEGEGATYTVTGTRTLPGTSDNTFTYALKEGTSGDNYDIIVVLGTLTINDRVAKYEITVEANSGEYLYDRTEKSVSGFKTLEYTFEVNGTTVKYTVEGLSASVSATDAGTYTSKVEGTAVVKDSAGNDVTDQFIVKTVDGTLTINKRAVTLTSATASKEYDGTPLTNDTVTEDGWADGEGATYDVTGSQLLVGISANEFTYTLNDNTKADNYIITKTLGQLTVTDRTAKYQITVVANSGEYKYDGTEKTVSGFKSLSFTLEANGQTYTVSGLNAGAEGTDAGSYTAKVEGTAVVKDAYGNDVTKQFAVTAQAGTLTITKREVTLTSATDSKQYDGNALTNGTVTVTGDGWAEGEGAAYIVTGSQTLVGSSENYFTYKLNDNTKADNYTITTINGTLTVTNRANKYEITVEANSGAFKYDGTKKTVSGLKEETFVVDGNTYTVSGLTASATATDADTYAVNVVGTPVVKDSKGNDVTNQFAVSTKNGTLVITKREVTLTSATASKEYDGKALTNDTVTVTGDGFAEGEGATYTVTGSQTLVGSCNNAFTYALNEGTKAENYDITKVEGTLTVTNRDEKFAIIVEANSDEFEYDGTEKTVEGFKTLTFTVNGEKFTVEGVEAKRTETEPGEYEVEITGTPVVKDANGNDVTAQFTVTLVPGLLRINLRQLEVTKTVDKSSAKPGDTLTYTITVKNTGNVTMENIKLADVLSNGEVLELVDANGNVVAEIEALEPGSDAVVLNAIYKVTSKDANKTLSNTVVAEAEDGTKGEGSDEGTKVTIPHTPTLNKKDHVAYIIGYEDNTVRPENNITRAEVATIFFRLLTDNSRAYYWSQSNDFSDVNSGDWYNNAVSTMANAGIITGYPDGTFKPNNPITRAEFAAIAARFSDVAYDGKCTFSDVSASHWANDEIALAEHLGWITGYPGNTFCPDKNITRAEAMTLINRVLERAVEEEHMLPDMVKWTDNQPSAWYYEAVQEATNSHEYTRLSKVVPGQDFCYEDWTDILLPPDWAALEKSWSDANDQ